MFTLYILQSSKNGRFYIGQTDHLIRRFHEHTSGKNKATRNRGPWQVIYCEYFDTRSAAVKRERQLKKWKSRVKVKQLILVRQKQLDYRDEDTL